MIFAFLCLSNSWRMDPSVLYHILMAGWPPLIEKKVDQTQRAPHRRLRSENQEGINLLGENTDSLIVAMMEPSESISRK